MLGESHCMFTYHSVAPIKTKRHMFFNRYDYKRIDVYIALSC